MDLEALENNRNMERDQLYIEAFKCLKKLNVIVGEGSGSETGYFISIDTDISEDVYNLLKKAFSKSDDDKSN